MAVGLKTSYYWFQIGTGAFLNSFFFTICFNLEDKVWGSKYPFIMNELYMGKLTSNNVSGAILELNEIREKLKDYPPEKVIWEIDDPKKKPPWGNNICNSITDLSNYFVTSDGDDFIIILLSALIKAENLKTDLEIINV